MEQSRNPMSRLTVDGQKALRDICRRHGAGEESGMALLDALSRTNGTMAQFNLPELGGSGQWMAGGMVMVGDMFNQGLKARVDGLCCDLAAMLATSPFRPAPTPSSVRLFVGAHGGAVGQWWPTSLGTPDWQGSQNDLRYAYFAGIARLALDINGDVAVYDTGGFTLTGVGQQQTSGYGASLTFTGPGGTVTLDRLRRVDGVCAAASAGGSTGPSVGTPEPTGGDGRGRSGDRPKSSADDVLATDPGDVPDDRLSGTRWLYASHQGAAIPVTLGAEGVLVGPDDDAIRYWAVEEGVLWIYAADGRATARFDRIVHGSEGMEIVGTSPPGSGAPVVLRAQAASVVKAVMPTTFGQTMLTLRLDLCEHEWTFGEHGKGTIATLRLHADGALSGSPRPTESSWRLDGSHLVFLHKSGRPTARFTTIVVRDGHWTLSGSSLANDRVAYDLSDG